MTCIPLLTNTIPMSMSNLLNIRIPEAKTQQQCKHSCKTEDEYIQNFSFLRLTVDILHHLSYSLMKHKVFPNQSNRTRHEPKAILLLMQIDSEIKIKKLIVFALLLVFLVIMRYLEYHQQIMSFLFFSI